MNDTPMRIHLARLLLTLTLALAGCQGVTASPAPRPSQTLPQVLAPLTGQPFTLQPGETALVQNTDLALNFENVTQDSRCPKDVQCVWSGEAVIALLATRAGQEPHRLELSTLPEKSRANVFDYLVELRLVEPYPQKAAGSIPIQDYTITLVVFSR